MNSYEISDKLEEYGYIGDNANQTISMLYLLHAASIFNIDDGKIWDGLQTKHALYGNVGNIYLEGTKSLWFSLLDSGERIDYPGCTVCYMIRGDEFDSGVANGDILIKIFA